MVRGRDGPGWNCLDISDWTPSNKWFVTCFSRTGGDLPARTEITQVSDTVLASLEIAFLWPKPQLATIHMEIL